MRKVGSIIIITLIAICNTGCVARQVAKDSIDLRLALVDLYSEQAFDNLVRAYNKQPFVQLSFSQLSVNDQEKLTAMATGNEAGFTSSKTTDLTKTGFASQFVRGSGFTGKFPFGFKGERNRVLSFHADPVIDQNWIYEDYLEFANNPALFQVSASEPRGCVYRKTFRCGKWHWVPQQSGHAFLDLVLKTSLIPDAAGPLIFWESTINSAVLRENKVGEPVPGKVELSLSKQVPNDKARVVLLLKSGRKLWVQAIPIEPQVDKPDDVIPAIGGLTDRMFVEMNPDVELDSLKGASLQMFAENFQNENPKQNSDLKKIQDALENIRVLLTKANISN